MPIWLYLFIVPEYYHIYQDEKGNDLHGAAQIIIAKHRKGATKDVFAQFSVVNILDSKIRKILIWTPLHQ
jgi:hypothetical protein